ncbi:MAG: beta-ketoacyl-[acyl-carrier-protein] synthase family protein [Candidatus Omnitrophica bacterium]|nr:beta-ketoacyl-[acyl-carrier-protein] synthase family protein [Candidatus Omnitrophota bacterium]
MQRQVVVTGVGVITPIGIGKENFRDALWNGRCGIGDIARFNTQGFPVKKSAEVKDFPCRKEWEGFDRHIQFALLAAEEAIADAGLTPSDLSHPMTGMTVSSSKGGFETLEKLHEEFLKNGSVINLACIFGNFTLNAVSGHIANKYKIRGPITNVVTACSTGTHSIIAGERMIRQGDADVVLAGASESSITPLLMAGYFKMGALARDCIRPFDKNRDGFIPGEGAAILVLEEKNRAERRRAHCYGEITASFRGEEPGHITGLSQEGEVLSEGLKQLKAGAPDSGVDYINAHGTATKSGDIYETVNIKKAFGKRAGGISLSSTKSMTGHLLGSAGAVEAVVCLLAMEGNFVPPTINYVTRDPECDLDYTPNRIVKREINTAVSISIGFGGHIGILMFRKGEK